MLVLTLMIVMVLTILAAGVLTLTANSLHLGRLRIAQVEAFNIAESGAEMAALWLRQQSTPPSQLEPFDPLGGPQTLGNGSYRVIIYPSPENATSYLKTYKIVSTGTVGRISKKVEVVVRQATFGRFAYFTDSEVSSISGGAIWWKAGEICDGPAHSNNTNGSNFQINYSGSTAPIFLDMLTASGTTINYSPSRPRDEETFKRIFLNGSKGFKLGVPRIEMPPSTDVQRNAAWGASSGFPSQNGVYLRADNNGGIYIRGDCTIQLNAPSSTIQEVVIKQGSNTTTIRVDLATRTSTMTKPDGSTVTAGLPNGVIYCTGNITSLKGTVANNHVAFGEIVTRSAWTIATDVNNGKDITITDNLVYLTKPDKTKPSDDPVNLAAGTLGLVGRNIVISSSAPANLEIDAVCLAGGQNTSSGSFYVSNYNTKTPVGTLTVIGGIIQKSRGPVGTFNSSTGQTITGYAKNYKYDPRLAADPPPFYPTTGTYDRISWRVLSD
jgi:hypothetical protein